LPQGESLDYSSGQCRAILLGLPYPLFEKR
jgi:hypothetical protein